MYVCFDIIACSYTVFDCRDIGSKLFIGGLSWGVSEGTGALAVYLVRFFFLEIDGSLDSNSMQSRTPVGTYESEDKFMFDCLVV